jgi:hypothetical protein
MINSHKKSLNLVNFKDIKNDGGEPLYRDRLGVDLTAAAASHYIAAETINAVDSETIYHLRHDLFYAQNLSIYSNPGDKVASGLRRDVDFILEQQDSIGTSHSGKEVYRGIRFVAEHAIIYIDYHVYGDIVQSYYFGQLVDDTIGKIEAEEAARIAADAELDRKINAEQQARIAKDNELAGNIKTNTDDIGQNTSDIGVLDNRLSKHAALQARNKEGVDADGNPIVTKILGHVTVGTDPGDVAQVGDNGLLPVSIIPATGSETELYPAGYVYTQYPGQQPPAVLWPKFDWADITDSFAGSFFRAEGGGVLPFEGGLQPESLPNITGYFTPVNFGGHNPSISYDGPFTVTSVSDGSTYAGNGHRQARVLFDAALSSPAYGRRDEVAPQNETIRLWRRVGTITGTVTYYIYDVDGVYMGPRVLNVDEAGPIGYNPNTMTDIPPDGEQGEMTDFTLTPDSGITLREGSPQTVTIAPLPAGSDIGTTFNFVITDAETGTEYVDTFPAGSVSATDYFTSITLDGYDLVIDGGSVIVLPTGDYGVPPGYYVEMPRDYTVAITLNGITHTIQLTSLSIWRAARTGEAVSMIWRDLVGSLPAMQQPAAHPEAAALPVATVFDRAAGRWVTVPDTRGRTAYNKQTAAGRPLTGFAQPTADETLQDPGAIINPIWDDVTGTWLAGPVPEDETPVDDDNQP